MNDTERGELKALVAAHPEPFVVTVDCATEDIWTYESIMQGDNYADIEACESDHDFLGDMTKRANACGPLMTRLEAAEKVIAAARQFVEGYARDEQLHDALAAYDAAREASHD